MKNRILFGTMLALLLVGSVSFADDEADKMRLLEEYDKMQAEKAKEAERLAERMDVEVQRIKKRMMEINDKIENYNKTNEMIDNLEKNVGELERKVNY